ncbi:MAG: SPW repeat domain-containing protein [Elusimicrobiota bacterium]
MIGALANAALGLWLMAAPAVLGFSGSGADNDHVAGPLIVTFAVMAVWEFMRPVRWMNLLLGLWMIGAAFFFHETGAGRVNAAACGISAALLSLWRGVHRPERYGGGWSSLRR